MLDLDEMSQLYEAHGGWKSISGRAYNLKGILGKKKIFLVVFLSYCSSFHGMMHANLAVVGGGDFKYIYMLGWGES